MISVSKCGRKISLSHHQCFWLLLLFSLAMPAPAASFVFAFLLCIVVGTALVAQQSCPDECRSFVSFGNSVGQAVIGPSVSLSWSVKQATTTTVQQVAVVVHVLSQEETFVLNRYLRKRTFNQINQLL